MARRRDEEPLPARQIATKVSADPVGTVTLGVLSGIGFAIGIGIIQMVTKEIKRRR